MKESIWASVWLAVFFINIVGYLTAMRDKRAAQRHARRTPEKTFVILSALCGGIGVLIGFYSLRHKTKHHGLLAAVWSSALVSTSIFLWLYFSQM